MCRYNQTEFKEFVDKRRNHYQICGIKEATTTMINGIKKEIIEGTLKPLRSVDISTIWAISLYFFMCNIVSLFIILQNKYYPFSNIVNFFVDVILISIPIALIIPQITLFIIIWWGTILLFNSTKTFYNAKIDFFEEKRYSINFKLKIKKFLLPIFNSTLFLIIGAIVLYGLIFICDAISLKVLNTNFFN